jgi:cardiolipin synthase
MSPVDTGSKRGTDVTSASAFEVLWFRQAEWQRRLTMVRQAERFIYLSIFYIEYDTYGREMIGALLGAQQRGVRVQVIIDTFGQRLGGVLMSPDAKRGLSADLDRLRAAGGQVLFYRPPRWVQRRLAGGHHVKVQVSDAGEALLASGNITKSSFEGWNECAVAVRGDIAPALLASCRDIGGDVSEEDLALLRARATEDQAAGERIDVDYWFCNPNLHQGPLGALGWRGPNTLTDQMIEMVNAARATLHITSFYFKPTAVLFEAVLAAARRGVQVKVFHSHRDALPATDLAWIAAAVGYDRLLDAGVQIFERRDGEHSKIVLVDDMWVAYGSYNFEDAAHDRLAEAMIASRDQRAVDPARDIFARLQADAGNARVTRETIAQWPDAVKTRISRYGRFKRWM